MASVIIAIKNLLIFLSPFMLGWIVYSYIFSKLIYSFAKSYFNLNMSFSRTWAITFLSGITSFIIILILIFLSFSYSVNVTTIDYFIAIIVPAFITSLIAYKFLSNVNLRVAIFMSFATFLAYIIFIIIALYLYNILFPSQICCGLHYIK
jgi:hypothetical protein